MQFKSTTIPPAGRNKYGNYQSADNITKAVISTTYYGDGTTNSGKPKDPEPSTPAEDSFLLFLSKTYNKFDGKEIALADATDTVNVIGYKNLTQCDTYVGEISGETEEGTTIEGYGIVGLPESGMTVSVTDNGTPNTVISITISSAITATRGTLRIPCNVYRASVVDNPLGDDIIAWESFRDSCTTLWLEYTWDVITIPTDAYTLELTNENASINCDADGNVLAGAVRPSCEAMLYYGTDKVDGVVYGVSYPTTQNVAGVSIDTSTGALTFGSNFSFDGTPLELQITATYKDEIVGRKIMTISKSYPGTDGQSAVSRWVKTSASAIYVDYNTTPPKVVPEAISVTAYKQVGENSPTEADDITIYYGWDTDTPGLEYSGNIAVDVSKSYLAVGLKNSEGYYYDLETIPLIEAGINGTNGTDGKDGVSAYRLDLTNDNASINCDSDGNVLAGAYKPTCTARLFYGTALVDNAVYEITSMSETTDITIGSASGILTIGDISFTGTSLEVNIAAKIGGVIYGQAIFSLSKSIAGKNGSDGKDGEDGIDGANGADGVDGTSMVFKGTYASHPSNPSNGWCYYNSTDKKSYVYQDGAWYQMTVDGVDGQNGTNGSDGLSIVWKGDLSTAPSNPSTNWCYRDTDNGMVYIYNGSSWELMVVDGSDGADGADGSDGLSVFITYNDNALSSAPSTPTGDGTTGGWHTTATSAVKWMSQKVASASTAGTWGTPIPICGADGQNGSNGADGVNGKDGADGTSIVWKGTYSSHPSSPSNGWAYYNSTDKKSYIYQDSAWYQMTIDGTDGQDGKDGSNGSDGLSIVWKGDLSSAPSSPQTNWCYRDTDNGKVYIYNGSAWELMVLDGSDGADGADGSDGLSVFITYNDNALSSAPSTPTGNGTTNGWHTTATSAANWMSQKVASASTAGTWGTPIQICGADGQNGSNGSDGKDGADGQDAVTYWLALSANEVKVNKFGVPAPTTISAIAYRQIGSGTPTNVTSSMVIKYGFNTVSPQTIYSSAVTIPANTTYSYLTFALYTTDGVMVDGNETIAILKDGADGASGATGAQGRQGAAMRGPVDYYKQTTSRRFCNGTLTSSSYPEDAEFIDLILKDDVIYVCNTSYTGSANDTWSNVSSKWTATDKTYDFVATNLLLADNASIDFTTSNALYLRDSGGTITAGAEGGNGTSFWAGANEPDNAAFKVNYDGTMQATKGKFGLLSIGTDGWDDSALYGTSTQGDGTINNLSIQPHYFQMEALDPDDGSVLESVRIAPYADPDKYDLDGVITVYTSTDTKTGVYTDGRMAAEAFTKRVNTHVMYAPFAPVNNLEITFITDTNYFTMSGGYWYWKGLPLYNYSATSYPYAVKGSSGEWCLATSSAATTGLGTGIYTTSHTKQNNRLYIVI